MVTRSTPVLLVPAIYSRRATVKLGESHAELRGIAESAFDGNILYEPIRFNQQFFCKLHALAHDILVQVTAHDGFELTRKICRVVVYR